jgi:hypothetical protein
MQYIPQHDLEEIERDRAEVARFNEHFEATFGQHYREHANDPEETDEERHARIASYDLGHPTIH